MSIRFACGAECGINASTLAVGGGVGHWFSIGGTPALETTVVRSGLRSYAFDAVGDLLNYALTAGQSVGYVRFYFRVTDATPASDVYISEFDVAGNNMGLVITTAGNLQLSDTVNTTAASGITLAANEWFGAEIQRDGTADPTRYDWRIWSAATGWVNQTQRTVTGTSSQVNFGFGFLTGSGLTLYIDDIVIGASTTADQDWSDTVPHSGQVNILRPTADLTHSFSTSGNFKYENTTNFAQSATDVYTHLDAYPMTQTSEYISQNTSSSGLTKYCYIDFGPTESTLTSVHAVMPIWVVRAATTTACEMNIRASDNGTNWTNLIGNWGATGQDVSETSNLYRVPAANFAPPSGGSWDQTKVNGLVMQFGMSDDISPVPFVMGLAFEVAWLVEPPVTGSFTLNAVILKTVSGSSTVNAVITDAYDDLIRNTSGVQAYLPMHEASGATVMDLKSAHQGTASGGYTRNEAGILNGKSIRLANASDGLITLANAFSLGDGPYTYEIWFKRATVTTAHWNALFGQNFTGTAFLAINEAGGGGDGAQDTLTSGATASTSGAQTTQPVADTTTFHHVAMTKTTGDVWAIWLDGVDITTSNGSGSTVSNAAALVIGSWPPDAATTCFDGWLTRAAVYNVVLSSTQIGDHYRAGLAGSIIVSAWIVSEYTVGVQSLLPDGYWPLDDADGNVRDASDNGRPGLAAFSPAYEQVGPTIAGEVQRAIDLDGVSERFEANESVDNGVVAFTVALWIKTTSGAGQGLIGQFLGDTNAQSSWALWQQTPGQVALFTYSGSIDASAWPQTSGTYIDGNWHLVVAWRDTNGDLHVRVDDTDQDDVTYAETAITWNGDVTTPLQIGNTVGFFDGAMAHVAYWKRALDSSERTSLYTGGFGLTVTGSFTANAVIKKTQTPSIADTFPDKVNLTSPTAYWRLGDASGNATDSSGNGRTLTAGGTITYGVSGWAGDGSTGVDLSAGGWFTLANAAWMSPGVNDFSVMWAGKLSSWPVADAQILGHDGQGNVGEWEVYHESSTTGSVKTETGTEVILDPNLGVTGHLSDNAWHLVFVTMDRDGMAEWYVDGVRMNDDEDISAFVASDRTNTRAIWLGNRSAAGPRQYTGSLAEVAFWNSSLLSYETIAGLYAARNATGVGFTADAFITDAYDDLILGESGVVAYLPMNETSGRYLSDIVGNHDGTAGLVGGGSYTLGQSGLQGGGKSVLLTAVSNSVGAQIGLAGSFSLGDGPFTYELWFKRASANTRWQGLFNQDATNTPGMGLAGNLGHILEGFARDGADAVDTSLTVTDTTTFHHFVLTKPATGNWTIYLDGANATATTVTYDTVSSASAVYIGSWPDFNFFDGWVTRAAIYNVELNSTQVTTHYAMGAGGGGGSFTADAVVKKTITGSFTASAVIKKAQTSHYDGAVLAMFGADLVAYWPADDASGSLIDAANAWDAALTAGSPTYRVAGPTINGVAQYAVQTDGASYFRPSASITPASATTGRTLFAWVFLPSTSSAAGVILSRIGTSQREMSIQHTAGGNAYVEAFQSDGTTVVAATSADDLDGGVWHLVVGWWDPADDDVRVAVDGISPQTGAGTTDIKTNSTTEYSLFAHRAGNTFLRSGSRLSKVGILHRVITSGERALLYSGAATLTPFTLDASLVRTVPGSFTANAIIKATVASSSTANAVIKKTIAGTFTANATIVKTVSSSFTANAVIKRTQASSFTANAVIFRNQTGSFTANAVVFKTIAGSFTANASLVKTVSSSFTANAVIKREQTGSFTADASIVRTVTGAFTANAAIKATVAGSTTANAVVKKTMASSTTANAVIKKTLAASSAANAVIKRTQTSSFTANAVVVRNQLGSSTAAATIKKTQSGSYVLDAVRLGTATSGFTASAVLVAPRTGSTTANAVIKREQTSSRTADAVVSKTISSSFAAEAWVIVVRTDDFTLDAIRLHPGDWSETYGNSVSSTGTGSFTADATILRTQAATFALDAVVTKLQTGSLTANAVLLKTTAGSFTAAAVIRSTLTGSTTANAVILRAGTATFAANAIVRATRSGSFVASAVVKAARAGSFDLSASVLRQQTGVLALDAVAKRTQVGAFTLDAVRRALGTGSFDLQATVLRQMADDYTVAAVIRKINADDYTLDAVVRKVWTEDLTLDAVLRKQATNAFSVDAVALATPTGQFALEATKALQVYDDFTVEAVLERTTEQSFGLFAVLQLHAEAGVTADAVVLRTQTGSLTARAWLSGIFRLDAVVLRTQVGSFSANAVIMPVFRLDAVVKKTITSASTIDAFIGGVGVAAFSVDAVLRRTSSQTFQASSVIKAVGLGAYTVDADLQATQVGQWVLEATKRAVIESSFDVDAVLSRAHLDDFTADAAIRAVELGSFSVDACLSKTQAGDDSLDAIVLAHQSSSYLTDAIVRAQRTGSFTLDASIPGAGVGSFAVSAVITRTASATIAANAVLRKTFTSTFTADALLKRATQAAFAANAVVKATRTGGTATNAVLLSPRISGFTADANIVIGAGSGSILLDAVVRGSLTGDFSASALFLRSFTGSLSADAILERTAVGSATLDASISSVGALSFTLDANIFSQTAGTFTIDASISRHIALEIAATFSAATIAAVNTAGMLDATYDSVTIAGSMSADTLDFTWYDTRRTTFSLDAEVQ